VYITIQPSCIAGEILAPTSKSAMQRACAAALITKGKSIIHRPGHSNDDKAALSIIAELGATVTRQIKDDTLLIESNGIAPIGDSIHCGESGLSIRMFTPLAALSSKPITVNGEGSLLLRPMNFFDSVLPLLNVTVKSTKGKLPLVIQGPLTPKNITVDGSLSSQFLTGLIMAYSACHAKDVCITVTNLKSKPYIDLTLGIMKKFGLPVPEHHKYEAFYFKGGEVAAITPPHPNYTVEGDWSGGSFLLVASAIAGDITVKGLNRASLQADVRILDALRETGSDLNFTDTTINIVPPAEGMKSFYFNATDCPDLFPPLVALAAYCKGKTVIAGVERLAYKESNRGVTLQEEFGKMGVAIELNGDLMVVDGGGTLKGATVHSHHDHRIAMACAIAALRADGPVLIEAAQAVNKSYPAFYQDLAWLGAIVD
jgi:3-phosphoshikimate 1-carboxyvinyltransferase